MLGRRSAQSGLFDAGNLLGAEQVRKIPFYGHLAATWREIFRDEDFAEFYADVGRWSVPPSILATATVLQRFENISDAEVVERTKYDLRWKAVFDTDPCSLQPLFAKSSLQLFRLRPAYLDAVHGRSPSAIVTLDKLAPTPCRTHRTGSAARPGTQGRRARWPPARPRRSATGSRPPRWSARRALCARAARFGAESRLRAL